MDHFKQHSEMYCTEAHVAYPMFSSLLYFFSLSTVIKTPILLYQNQEAMLWGMKIKSNDQNLSFKMFTLTP